MKKLVLFIVMLFFTSVLFTCTEEIIYPSGEGGTTEENPDQWNPNASGEGGATEENPDQWNPESSSFPIYEYNNMGEWD